MAGRADDNGLFKRGRRWWLAIYIPGTGKRNLPLRAPGETRATLNIHVARGLAADIRRQLKNDAAAVDYGTSSANVQSLIAEFQAVNASEGSPAQAKDNAARVRAFCGEFRATDQYGRFDKAMPQAVHIRQVDLERLQRWFIHLRQQGRSPKTLWNWRAALSRFCEFLIDRKLIAENPCRRVKVGKLEKLLPRFLSPEDHDRALQLAQQLGMYAEVATALYTGLRREELRRLQWADVDFARAVVIVRKSKNKTPRQVPLKSEPAGDPAGSSRDHGQRSVRISRSTAPRAFRHAPCRLVE